MQVTYFKILFLGTLFTFLVLPVGLLWKHSKNPQKFELGMAILVMMGLGWILVNATVHLYGLYLEALVDSYRGDPPEELLTRFTTDGARNVFALFFGWLYGPIYFLPFALVYLIGRDLRVWWKRRTLQNRGLKP
jgi:hypothetical protein